MRLLRPYRAFDYRLASVFSTLVSAAMTCTRVLLGMLAAGRLLLMGLLLMARLMLILRRVLRMLLLLMGSLLVRSLLMRGLLLVSRVLLVARRLLLIVSSPLLVVSGFFLIVSGLLLVTAGLLRFAVCLILLLLARGLLAAILLVLLLLARRLRVASRRVALFLRRLLCVSRFVVLIDRSGFIHMARLSRCLHRVALGAALVHGAHHGPMIIWLRVSHPVAVLAQPVGMVGLNPGRVLIVPPLAVVPVVLRVVGAVGVVPTGLP
jgi:hypothetical protein